MAPADSNVRATGSDRSNRPQVLLVEDSWHVASAISAVLEGLSLSTLGPASSLTRAHALLDDSIPAIAIVDLNIKGQMSYPLIERLLEKGVPVVVVSGYTNPDSLDDRIAASLGKPIDAASLIAALKPLLSPVHPDH